MSNNDNRIKKFLKRFNTNKGTKIIIWILITITVVSYFVFSYLVNNITINSVNVSTLTDNWQYNLFCVLKETCIVVSSGLGINLLVSLLIERKNQNKAFEEFFANDIISSPKFYTSLSEEDKMRMLYALETHCYHDSSDIKKKMYESITKKLQSSTSQGYIIKDCDYNVSCYIYDDYIEKKFEKTIRIIPSNNKRTIREFPIIRNSSMKIKGMDAVKLESIKIDNKSYDIEHDVDFKEGNNENGLERKLGYIDTQWMKLKPKIKFKGNKVIPKKIEIEFITRVPITDLSYVCRMSNPCEKFSFAFEIENCNDYKVNAYAFGFIDDGKDAPNVGKEGKVKIKFNDWIFPRDGVAISLHKINN